MADYSITFEHCKTLIHGVCRQCGGELTPIETVDNSNNPTYWPHCSKCSIFEYGVEPMIHEIAKELVMSKGYTHYSHMSKFDYEKSEDSLQYFYDSQIGGTCSIVSDVLNIFKKMQQKQLNVQIQ